ncbi:MAG: type II toxin-antitoxin system RelE/ParE family toxin [Sphingomonadales bacterium]|nr:type II toxin-antitoxin system RelE/ParE family toxin [Sphingomonadales bacterium]
MSAQYVLTLAAEADLRRIVRYTRKAWGDAQARRYAAQLEHGLEAVASGQSAFRDMSALYPGLRMARCEHHFLFVLVNGTVKIRGSGKVKFPASGFGQSGVWC